MGEAFTDNIPEILTAMGFDTKTALKSMNIQCVNSIENFINQNRNHHQGILEGTKYENTEIFKFLPGHCALILALPEYIQALSSVLGRKRKHSETIDHPQSSSVDHPSTLVVDGDKIDDNIKTKIKEQLINKINNFSTKRNINVKIYDNHILNFRYENNSYKCLVQCTACAKSVPCKYIKHWVCGNFETHIKTHSAQHSEEYEVQDNQTLRLIEKSPSTKIARIDNNIELHRILNI